jgi:hypothetical protein
MIHPSGIRLAIGVPSATRNMSHSLLTNTHVHKIICNNFFMWRYYCLTSRHAHSHHLAYVTIHQYGSKHHQVKSNLFNCKESYSVNLSGVIWSFEIL